MEDKKINKKILNTFIDSATKCVYNEIENDRHFYFEDYSNDLVSNSKCLTDFFNSDARLQDENNFFDLLSNALEKCPDNQTQIFSGDVSADSYWRVSYLSILKFGKLFYCFYKGDELERCVATDPLDFLQEAIQAEESVYRMEMNALKENEKTKEVECFTVDLHFIDGLFD